MSDEKKQAPIDPRRRVFVPVEKRGVDGQWRFRTSDGQLYRRDESGAIRRVDMRKLKEVAEG